MPGLIKQLSNGVLYGVFKNPQKLLKQMFSFLEGHGGIIAMLKLQSNGDVPVPEAGAAEDAKKYLGVRYRPLISCSKFKKLFIF